MAGRRVEIFVQNSQNSEAGNPFLCLIPPPLFTENNSAMAHLYLPPPPGSPPPPAWRHSPAKKQLRDGILLGRYKDTLSEEFIYGSDVIFRQYKWANFKTNLTNLRASLGLNLARALADAANVEADQKRHAAQVAHLQIWAGSAAESFLKKDIDEGRNIGMAPSDLRETRLEYKEWPLKVFRDHVEQEKRGRKTQAYWLHREKKSKKEKAMEPWPKIYSK